jgi:hypothetical protein
MMHEALDAAANLAEVKTIRDRAEVVRLHARQSRESLDVQNEAAEIRIRAERKAGEMLREAVRHGGDRKSKSNDATLITRLCDLDISRDASSRWQTIASLTDEAFEGYIEETKRSGKELTTSGLLSLAKSIRERKRIEEPVASPSQEEALSDFYDFIDAGGRLGTILVDVPWEEDDRNCSAPTMTPEQIAQISIPSLVAGEAHVYLWVPNEFLSAALEILSAWGFKHAGTLVYREPKMDGRNCWTVADELLLLGVRGSDSFLDETRRKWQQINQGRYGADVWEVIKRVSPKPWGQMGEGPSRKRRTA